jgi:hypothetical protein
MHAWGPEGLSTKATLPDFAQKINERRISPLLARIITPINTLDVVLPPVLVSRNSLVTPGKTGWREYSPEILNVNYFFLAHNLVACFYELRV